MQQLSPDKLKPYERNPRKNAKAVDVVARSIELYGFRQPIVVDKDMVIVVGHTRWLAAKKLKLETVPVHVAEDLTPAQAKAYRIADNRSQEFSGWDEGLLLQEIEDLQREGVQFDDIGFSNADLAQLMNEITQGGSAPKAAGALAKRFIIPPFSVFNAREGWWQSRKAAWIALGIQSELGRGGGILMQAEQVTTENLNYYRNRKKTAQVDRPGPRVIIPGGSAETARGDQ